MTAADVSGAWELVEVALPADVLAYSDEERFRAQRPTWLTTTDHDLTALAWAPAAETFDGFGGAGLEIDDETCFREVFGAGGWGLLYEDGRHDGRVPHATGRLDVSDDDVTWLIRSGAAGRARTTVDDVEISDLIRPDPQRPGCLIRVKSAVADDGYALQRAFFRYEKVPTLRTVEPVDLGALPVPGYADGLRVEQQLPTELAERLDRTHQAVFDQVPDAVAINCHYTLLMSVDPDGGRMSRGGAWHVRRENGRMTSNDLLDDAMTAQPRWDSRTMNVLLDWLVEVYADRAHPDADGSAQWQLLGHRPRGGALRLLAFVGEAAWGLTNADGPESFRQIRNQLEESP